MRVSKQTAKCNTGPPVHSVGQESGSSPEGLARRALALSRKYGRATENILAQVYFLLACSDESCILRMQLASFSGVTAGRSPERRERVSIRRTRVKIEFYIASRPATFPRNPNSEKKSRQTYALAACGSHLLHGVWRHVRHGRDHSWRGLRSRDIDPAAAAGAVVPADGVHDWRAVECAAARRWLLRVGAPRLGKFLGLPGSMALVGCQHL